MSEFTLNRVPSKSVTEIPYEMWNGNVSDLSIMEIWSCETYIKRLISDKLTPKSDKCYFIGCPNKTKACYFYNQFENKLFVARNNVFLRKIFFPRRTVGVKYELEEIRKSQKTAQPVEEEQQLDLQRVVEQNDVY